MNTELLLKIRDKILAEPENFIMSTWHCGTAHCIAGWAQILTKKSAWENTTWVDGCEALKIHSADADRLFLKKYWPAEFTKPCTVADQRAKQAAARILHFISTEGRE